MEKKIDEQKPEITLDAALLAAQMAIGIAAKDSTNAFHKYNYVSADAMVEHARQVLHAHGLTFTQVEVARMGDPDADGRPVEWLRIDYRLTHAASGASLTVAHAMPAVPERGRPHDKAVCGAMTVSLSYALRGLLLIPREDENEPDKRDDTKHTPPRLLVSIPRKDCSPSPSVPSRAAKESAPATGGPRPNWQSEKWPAGAMVEELRGTLDQVSAKAGETNGKKWTRFGLRLGDAWVNTFDAVAARVAEANVGHPVVVEWAKGRGESRDLLGIRPDVADDAIPF